MSRKFWVWITHGINLRREREAREIVFRKDLFCDRCRWLIGKGKLDRAIKIIGSIEKINKTKIPPDIYEDFFQDCIKTASELAAEEHTIADLFKTRRLRYCNYY